MTTFTNLPHLTQSATSANTPNTAANQSGGSAGSNDNLNLIELLQPLQKWWWLVAVSALLAVLSSTFYTMQQPLLYSSSTTIMVGTALSEPNPNGNEFSLASQLAAAYADIASRSTIQNATKAVLGLTWLPDYTARHIPNTQLLEITVIDTLPERAQAVSSTLAKQLVLISPGGQAQQGRQQFIDSQLAQIEQAINETDAEIDRLELEMAQMFSARQIADTRAQLAALESKRASLQNNYSAMFSNSNRSATNTIVVVEDATLPTTPLNDNLLRNMILAAMLGAAVAGAGAYLLESTNNTIKSEHELQKVFGLMTLGLLPHTHQPAMPIALQATRNESTDAYAALRLNLQALLHRQALNTIAITGLLGDEQHAFVTANLCIELARAGKKIILVDADLHRPVQQRFFNLPNRIGLSSLLADPTLQLDALLQTTETHGLSVLPSGPLPANPAALLSEQGLQELLVQLRCQADLVIFNLPPINAVIDGLLLANEMQGVIVTVVAQQTRRQDLEHTIEAIQRINVPLIGTILCRAPSASHRQSYSYDPAPQPPVQVLAKNDQPLSTNGLGATANDNHHPGDNHSSIHNNNHHNNHATFLHAGNHAPDSPSTKLAPSPSMTGSTDQHRIPTSRRNPLMRR